MIIQEQVQYGGVGDDVLMVGNIEVPLPGQRPARPYSTRRLSAGAALANRYDCQPTASVATTKTSPFASR